MYEGSVEILSDGIKMLTERAEFGTYLPSIDKLHDEIYIPNVDSAEYQDWDAFISPFSTEMWMAIIMKCIVFSLARLPIYPACRLSLPGSLLKRETELLAG